MAAKSGDKSRGRLSVKQLESYLQDLDEFDSPRVDLEQYATPPHIAAMILNTIDLTYDDIEGKFVADLGCGTGRLAIGSVFCGAEMVVGFDIDTEALRSGLQNVIDIFGDDNDNGDSDSQPYRACSRINFVQADLAKLSDDKDQLMPFYKKFDTVVMNPPFGTKHNQGLDMIFLERAIEMACGSVYSLHKTSTREDRLRESLDFSEKRNIFASMVAGLLFFSGWWIIIDVGARYKADDFHVAFYILGVFGTLSFIIVNSISNSQLREDGYDSVNPRAAKGCLLLGFILGFSALTGSVWILISEYASSTKEDKATYPGVALLIQNILIFLGSLTFKFGRIEDQ